MMILLTDEQKLISNQQEYDLTLRCETFRGSIHEVACAFYD